MRSKPNKRRLADLRRRRHLAGRLLEQRDPFGFGERIELGQRNHDNRRRSDERGRPGCKVQLLADVFCDRAVSCNPKDAGSPAEQRASCGSALEGALNYLAATAICRELPHLRGGVAPSRCAKFASTGADVLPRSCKGVVQAPAAPCTAGTRNETAGGHEAEHDPRTFDVERAYDGDTYDVGPDSVTNAVGMYGSQSKFSASSIWNRFGIFGSDFRSQSCNQFALDPPVVVNRGQIVGRLTKPVLPQPTPSPDPAVVSFLSGSVCELRLSQPEAVLAAPRRARSSYVACLRRELWRMNARLEAGRLPRLSRCVVNVHRRLEDPRPMRAGDLQSPIL